MIGEAGAALVESDHVGDRPQSEEDRLARPAGRRDSGAAGSSGKVDDRRARPGAGRFEAKEADFDPARARIATILGHEEGPPLDGNLGSVGELEHGRLDAERGRRGRGRDGERAQQDGG
jgi:hypothetical protein